MPDSGRKGGLQLLSGLRMADSGRKGSLHLLSGLRMADSGQKGGLHHLAGLRMPDSGRKLIEFDRTMNRTESGRGNQALPGMRREASQGALSVFRKFKTQAKPIFN